MKFSTAVCGLGVILMTAGVATARTATQDVKAKTENAAKKTATVLTDAEITTAVKTKLLADKLVGGLKIDVDTDKGVVTLTGPVSSAAERAQALRLARTTKGVKRVVSKLTLSKSKTEPTSGHVPPADTTTAKKDETKVVIKDDTTPAVKKGAEKTKDVAKDIAGKTEDVAKKTGNAIEDGSITTAVKTRLMTDDVARGTSIDVDTSHGIVTIRGSVPTAADKARIGQLVEKTTGVKSVVNNLSVK